MKDTRPIEEQVAELTEEQKKTVIKVNRYGIAAMVLTTLLSFIAMIIAAVVFIKTPRAYLYFDKFVIALIAIVMVNLILCIGEYIFIKVKFPYYSDKRRSYIKKEQKKKN